MAAPTLEAEGALSVVTTASVSPTIPTHQADDIIIVAAGALYPNTVGDANISLTNFTTLTGVELSDGFSTDASIQFFWLRATGAGTTATLIHDGDTGADTSFGARAYIIRGCITTGNPWDETDITVAYTAANEAVDALNVNGAERLAIHFLVKTDDFATAPTVSGWTAGTQVESTTGQDHSQGSFRQDNVNSSTSSAASTVSAPAGGIYAFLGVSFKPPVDAGTRVPYKTPYPQLLAH